MNEGARTEINGFVASNYVYLFLLACHQGFRKLCAKADNPVLSQKSFDADTFIFGSPLSACR